MTPLAAAGPLAFCVTAAFVPLLRRVAQGRGWLVAHPADDRWHRREVVKVGGIAMLAGLLSLLLFTATAPLSRLLVLAALMFCAGFIDDVRAVRPWTKLTAQITAAIVFLALGPLPHIVGIAWIDAVVSVAWIVFFTNAVNLLDNIDGLAAGIVLIAAGFSIALFAGAIADTSLMAGLTSTMGVTAAFLLYNRPPASVFMGDSGSHLLGSFLAGTALLITPPASHSASYVPMLALLFVVPLADTLLVIVTRTAARVSPFTGGRDHISHRLVVIGFSEGRAVFALNGCAIGGGLMALALQYLEPAIAWPAAAAFVTVTLAAAFSVGRVRIARHLPRTASGIPDTSAPARREETIAASSRASGARANPVL